MIKLVTKLEPRNHGDDAIGSVAQDRNAPARRRDPPTAQKPV